MSKTCTNPSVDSSSFLFRYKLNQSLSLEKIVKIKNLKVKGYDIFLIDRNNTEFKTFFSQELIYRKYRRFFQVTPLQGLRPIPSLCKGYFSISGAEFLKDSSYSYFIDVCSSIKPADKLFYENEKDFTENIELFHCEVTGKVFMSDHTPKPLLIGEEDYLHFAEIITTMGVVTISASNGRLFERMNQELSSICECMKISIERGKQNKCVVLRNLRVQYSKTDKRKFYEITEKTTASIEVTRNEHRSLRFVDLRTKSITLLIKQLADDKYHTDEHSDEEEAPDPVIQELKENIDPSHSGSISRFESSPEEIFEAGEEPFEEIPEAEPQQYFNTDFNPKCRVNRLFDEDSIITSIPFKKEIGEKSQDPSVLLPVVQRSFDELYSSLIINSKQQTDEFNFPEAQPRRKEIYDHHSDERVFTPKKKLNYNMSLHYDPPNKYTTFDSRKEHQKTARKRLIRPSSSHNYQLSRSDNNYDTEIDEKAEKIPSRPKYYYQKIDENSSEERNEIKDPLSLMYGVLSDGKTDLTSYFCPKTK